MPWGKAKRVGVVHPGQREGLRRPYRDLPVDRGPTGEMRKILVGPVVIGQSLNVENKRTKEEKMQTR